MNRRKFLKTMLGGAVVAALPGCKLPAGPTESVAIDLAKPGADRSEMMIGRYEGVRFIESTPQGRMYYSEAYDRSKWGVPVQEQGGFMYSDQLSETLRDSLKPANSYFGTSILEQRRIPSVQDEMNKIFSARVDRMVIAKPRFAGRSYVYKLHNEMAETMMAMKKDMLSRRIVG